MNSKSLEHKSIGELDRYLCAGWSQLFTVGHNSGVVSFYSQQCRAFHLSELLAEHLRKDHKEEPKVAIIGGGIAGVTLWTAMQQYGLGDTKLFEATENLLTRQSEARHRHAHPAINEWPLLSGGRSFSSTTKWPFLNWFGSDASSVATQLKSDPILTYYRNSNPDGIKLSHTVVGLAEEENELLGRNQVIVQFQTPNGDQVGAFDYVVSAMGYSFERDLEHSASKSYWWADHVKHYVRDRHDFSDHRIFISGTGDGGLIDAVRLAEKVSDTPSPNVALEVAAFSRAQEYKQLDNEWPEADKRESDLEIALKKAITNDKLSEANIAMYFEDLFKDQKFSARFVDDATLKRISLVSKTGSFIKGRSSFANKVLVTYLKSRAKNIVVKASIEDGVVVDASEAKVKLCEVRNDAGNVLQTIKILRHGAPPKIDQVLGRAVEVVDPKNSDSVLFDDPMSLAELREGLNPRDDARVARHLEALISKYFGMFFNDAKSRWTIDKDIGALQILAIVPRSEVNLLSYRKIGGFDRELFGIPLRYIDSEKLDLTEETFVDA